MSKLEEIKNESLRDGKGIIVHYTSFNWLIEQAEKVERYEKALKDIAECNGVLDIYDAVKRAKTEL